MHVDIRSLVYHCTTGERNTRGWASHKRGRDVWLWPSLFYLVSSWLAPYKSNHCDGDHGAQSKAINLPSLPARITSHPLLHPFPQATWAVYGGNNSWSWQTSPAWSWSTAMVAVIGYSVTRKINQPSLKSACPSLPTMIHGSVRCTSPSTLPSHYPHTDKNSSPLLQLSPLY